MAAQVSANVENAASPVTGAGASRFRAISDFVPPCGRVSDFSVALRLLLPAVSGNVNCSSWLNARASNPISRSVRAKSAAKPWRVKTLFGATRFTNSMRPGKSA